MIRAACANCSAHGCPACDGTGHLLVDVREDEWVNNTAAGPPYAVLWGGS